MQLSLATTQHEIISEIEPIFIEHFKITHGNTPSLIELKQHLVSIGIDGLIEHLRNMSEHVVSLYSKSELTQTIQIYIRKL